MNVARIWAGVAAIAGTALMGVGAASAQEMSGGATTSGMAMPSSPNVTQQALDGAARDRKNWIHANGDYTNSRYYPGNAIKLDDAWALAPAFVFQTAVLESMETAPIVVDGVMFLTTSFNHVYAINAATGEEYWHYRHATSPDRAGSCCVNANQGVAVAEGRVFMGTSDARLVALDGQTGRVLWSTPLADADAGYSTAMAPVVADGIVIIGIDTGEAGLRGFVKAFAAADGRLLWTFQTIPETGSEGVYARGSAIRPDAICTAMSRGRKRRSRRTAASTSRSAEASR